MINVLPSHVLLWKHGKGAICPRLLLPSRCYHCIQYPNNRHGKTRQKHVGLGAFGKERLICIWPERLSAFGLKDFLYWARKTSLICHKHK